MKETRFSRLKNLAGLGARIAGTAAVGWGDRLKSGKAAALENTHRKTAQILFDSLSKMKGLPMKMGQVLSFMDGAIPAEFQPIYRNVLKNLQVIARPVRWEEMEAVLEQELGQPKSSVFRSFEIKPIAAASIGQVYRAELHDGRTVAVKVQYPGIAAAMESDLKNLETLARALRAVLPHSDPDRITKDLVERFREELDYEQEAFNQATFSKLWAEDKRVVIPRIVEQWTRKRVLVSELETGSSFEEVLSRSDAAIRSTYGEVLFWFTFHSILSFGLFNADPHPGNFLFRPNGSVVFLDFGSVQHYDPAARAAFRTLLTSILAGVRGDSLWSEVESALLISPGTTAEVRAMLLEHLLATMEPVLAQQPFRYTTEFSSHVTAITMRLHQDIAKQIFKIQLREPQRPGLAPLSRILFGLNSLLAGLEAESDWRTLALEA